MSHDDCQYWRLTPDQCMRYHDRVYQYWTGQARYYAAKADHEWTIAIRLGYISLTVVALTIVIRLIEAIA